MEEGDETAEGRDEAAEEGDEAAEVGDEAPSSVTSAKSGAELLICRIKVFKVKGWITLDLVASTRNIVIERRRRERIDDGTLLLQR